MSDAVDRKYYEVVPTGSIAETLLVTARERIYSDFLKHAQPAASSLILDVGISDVAATGANWFETQYPNKQNLFACGLGEAAEFRSAFPEIDYRKIEPDKALPYADDQFDIATSNAVLEHVGSPQQQARFVSELARVGRAVFISVPHRYFPVEHHTGIPLLHYFDGSFRLACHLLGKEKWAQPEHLILMTRSLLERLAPGPSVIGYTGLRLGPCSSNLFLYYRKQCR